MELMSYKSIYKIHSKSKIKYWVWGVFFMLLVILFLPWTQNIRARGSVTTLKQEQRPQELNSVIPGKIIKWYVKEGDFVNKGDTILQIAEVKDEYFDPNIIDRTSEQLEAKQQNISYNKNKIATTQSQMGAIDNNRDIKQKQLQNKIVQLFLKQQSDSAEASAVTTDLGISEKQYKRQQILYDSGLVSLTQLEQRSLAFQNAKAKKIMAENKLANTRQELQNAMIEANAITQDFIEKLSKVQGDQFSALSQIATGQGELAKLKNLFATYNIRRGMYFIVAPQSGQITKAKKAGIGEMIKDGEMLVEIVPDKVDYAVELFVNPMDLPLLSIGQKVQFLFDGFPAIVFSGWPNNSYGTFSGNIVAIENSVSTNGKFRILVTEDSSAKKRWPKELKIGVGAQGFALLKNVPVWYELWRNINGFPPDYYPKDIKYNKK